jgi:hypothetical protein
VLSSIHKIKKIKTKVSKNQLVKVKQYAIKSPMAVDQRKKCHPQTTTTTTTITIAITITKTQEEEIMTKIKQLEPDQDPVIKIRRTQEIQLLK